MLSRLQLALAVAGLVAPAAAGAAPTVVLTAPRATLAVQDATHAAETAQRAAAAVDRIGYVTPHAFCLRVHSADYAPGDEGCESQQLPTTDDPVVYTETGVWVGGAVPAEAATVELVPAHGAPVRTPALAGDYDGVFAGRVRFFLASAPEPPRRIRVYDAGGALIGDDGFEPASVVGHRVALGGGRLSGHQRWSATAWAARATEPAAGAPERLEPADCLRVRLTARDGSSLAIPACQDSRRTAAGLLDLEPECTTRRIALAALLPPGLHRAVLTLGDGRGLALAGRRLPARFGPNRYAIAGVLPRREAVREIRAGGRVRRLAQEPATTGCHLGLPAPLRLGPAALPLSFGPASNDLFRPPQSPVAGAQPVAGDLLAALRGDDVCAALGSPPRFPDACAGAPLRARESRFAGRGREVGVVTAATVTTVTLLDAATQQPLASAQTVPAGAGRAALVTAPAGRRVLVARLVGADAHPLADIGLSPVALGPARTVARGRGWVATATRIAAPDSTPGIVIPRESTCVQVTRRPPRGLSGDCLEDFPGRVRAMVTCTPRLLHVFGAGRRATLVLADGRQRAATARHGAWHAVLRGREALRAVRVAGRTRDLAVPPAAAQCGYSAFG